MKKIITHIMLIILLSAPAISQKLNTVYLCFQPVDQGTGLRYDRCMGDFGAYCSLTRGSYTFSGGLIRDHWKVAAGAIYYQRVNRRTDLKPFLSFGVSYNSYSGILISSNFATKALKPISIEPGTGFNIRRFALAIRYEPFKKLSSIDFGYKF
jgi:hypothetical protein